MKMTMLVRVNSLFFSVVGLGSERGERVGEEGTEEEVLRDRKLGEHFSFVHFEHPRVDLVPGFDLRAGRSQ